MAEINMGLSQNLSLTAALTDAQIWMFLNGQTDRLPRGRLIKQQTQLSAVWFSHVSH